jgi:hypothetical protein
VHFLLCHTSGVKTEEIRTASSSGAGYDGPVVLDFLVLDVDLMAERATRRFGETPAFFLDEPVEHFSNDDHLDARRVGMQKRNFPTQI